MSEVIIIQASSWNDFQTIRHIRNECKDWMTESQTSINVLKQFKFYLINKFHLKQVTTYKVEITSLKLSKIVGYGIIRLDKKGNPWVTGGLSGAYRGQGLGRELFLFLTNHANPKPAYLAVLINNTPALNLYTSLGWIPISGPVDGKYGHKLYMKYR